MPHQHENKGILLKLRALKRRVDGARNEYARVDGVDVRGAIICTAAPGSWTEALAGFSGFVRQQISKSIGSADPTSVEVYHGMAALRRRDCAFPAVARRYR